MSAALRRLLIVLLSALASLGAAQAEVTARFVTASNGDFSRPHDLALSPDGRLLFVADSGDDAVKVLDPDSLETLAAIGIGQLAAPHDVAFDQEGYLLVADTGNDRIARFRLNGRTARLVDSLVGGLAGPQGVAVGPGGWIYVANVRSNEIVIFAGSDPIARAGGFGLGPGQFHRIHDIEVSPDGLVYAADPGNDRIQVLEGTLAPREWLGGAEYGFDEPKGFDLDPNGTLFVADEQNHQIKVVGPDRRIVLIIGNGEPGDGPGRFNRPDGVAVSGNRLWVSDSLNRRIVLYRLDGLPKGVPE